MVPDTQPTGDQHRIETAPVEHIEFTAGSVAAARREVRVTVEASLPESATLSDLKGHVVRVLLKQVPALDISDARELRVLLDVDHIAEEPMVEQIDAVFDAAIGIIAQWVSSSADTGGVPA